MKWAVAGATTVALIVVILMMRPDGSFAVDGSFILWDDYAGRSDGASCTGERSLYHGINSSTSVAVETVDGRRVGSTVLGEGRIASSADIAELARAAGQESTTGEVEALMTDVEVSPCLFTFRLMIDGGADGGDGYLIVLGRWGRLSMSESDLRRPGSVQLSVGLR